MAKTRAPDANLASTPSTDQGRNPHTWIWIDHCKDAVSGNEHYEATFRFSLEGVAQGSGVNAVEPEGRMRSDLGKAAFESVVEALFPGQRLEFVFSTFRSAENRPVLHWNIIGRTRGRTLEQARRHSELLWEGVTLMLNSQPNYRFRPSTVPPSEEALDWSYHLRPRTAAVAVATQPIGFRPLEASSAGFEVLLPLLDPQPGGPLPLLGMLGSLPLDLDLCIALEPVKIDEGTRKKIVKAKKALLGRVDSSTEWPGGYVLEREVIDTHLDQWQQMLDYWLAHKEAVRVLVTLQSDGPVTAGLLGLLGQAIHPNYSFEYEGDASLAIKKSAFAIRAADFPSNDLCGLIHEDHELLRVLFPDTRQLGDLDLPKSYPLPPSRLQRQGIRLGSSNGQAILLADSDRLRHNYIVGATGSGKSTLLLNLITQDIRAGHGVCLIDPHGDLYEEVLDRIPRERGKQVVLFNPSDFDRVTGLNFLECTTRFPEVEQSLIANEMLRIFDRLYDLRQTGGPMFEQYMRNALMLVMSSPESGGTLVDVPLLFENRDYRKKLLETSTQPMVVSFWEKQAEQASGQASLADIAPYITSKLNQFTHNPLMRRIIGQRKSTLNFREVMDKGGILLINLAKGMLSALDAQLLGMLVMGKLFHAGLGRIEMPIQQRKSFYVYVDEFQNFTTSTVGHMLSEARKFGLCMTLANQHLAQLQGVFQSDDLTDAVLGNVGNILLFRLGVLDAGKFEKFTLPWLSRQDLQYLPDFHVVARLLSNHAPIKPFVFKTDAKSKVLGGKLKEAITTYSRQRDTQASKDVDKAILELIMQAQNAGKK